MAKGKDGYKIRTIECICCGKVVTDHMREGQKYCSLACYRSNPRPQRKTGESRPCEHCGEGVYIKASQLKKSSFFFCSLEHQIAWQGRNRDHYQCKTCGIDFSWSPSRKMQTTPTYCTPACRDADPERREMLIQMNVEQAVKKTNKLEMSGYAILDEIGEEYERQKLMFGKFCVDAIYTNLRIIVQFDGDYWHGHPIKFPMPDARQTRRMNIDRSQDAYFAKAGYTVLRLWESEIKNDRAGAVGRVRAAIHTAAFPIAA